MSLTTPQLAELQRALERRHLQLLDEIRTVLKRSDSEHYRDLAGEVADVGESSVAHLLADLDIADVHRDVEEVRRIEAAKQRMRDGTYGVCEVCGGEIRIARLRANPFAKRCVSCQGFHERAEVYTPHASL